MTDITSTRLTPSRILYTMIRVADLDRSLAFYSNVLGMREIKRETFTEGRFTLVFVGYDDASPSALIELTYNWDDSAYAHGSAYGHVALKVDDIYATCERLQRLDVSIARAPGLMIHAPDESGLRETIAFVEDPDGYKIELIQKESGS